VKKSEELVFSGEIDSAAVVYVADALQTKDRPRRLLLNSEGGSVPDGYAMRDLIQLLAPNLEVVGIGQVQSMAIIPFLACKRRKCTRTTQFMIHQGTFQIESPEPQSDMPGMYRQLVRENKLYAELIAEATGLPLRKVNRMIEKGTFFGAQEALEMGFVQEII